MTNDLLPCPFCGGSAHYNFTDAGADRKYYRAHCSKCDARIGHPYVGKDAAATAWNTRTPNKPAEVDLDALKHEVEYADWNAYPPDKHSQSFRHDARGIHGTIDYLAKHGHLATGKGGGDVQHLDLDKASWEMIAKAAQQSDWIPRDYCVNDWVSDVCEFLKHGALQPAAPTQIDAGELEAAIDNLYSAAVESEYRTYGDPDDHVAVIRAHLEKSKGGV